MFAVILRVFITEKNHNEFKKNVFNVGKQNLMKLFPQIADLRKVIHGSLRWFTIYLLKH